MFIEMQSGGMLNLFWLQDCFQGKHDKKVVVFPLVNGVKLIETYDTEAEATARDDEVHTAMSNAGGGGGGGTGAVISVNDKTGVVTLRAIDIKASDGLTIQTHLNSIEAAIEWNQF